MQLHGFPNSHVGTSGQTILGTALAVARLSDISISSRLPGIGVDIALSTCPRPEGFVGSPGDSTADGTSDGEAAGPVP